MNITMRMCGTFMSMVLMCAICGQAFAQDAAPATLEELSVTGDGEIRLNFRGVPLDTVLDYFSKELGFIIVREAEVTGRVDVWSYQPITKDEAVDLLNTILHQKGFSAIRTGRTLLIVNRDDASQRNLPVVKEGNPENIEQSDEMVTQIIPVRHANAVKLIEDLRPLLPQYAVVSANESSNAIVLTDTKTNVRRMAEIIQALDTSISEVSSLKVFILRHSDATETALLINQLFSGTATGSADERRARFFASFRGGRGGRGDRDGDNGGGQTGTSEARQAASTVLAVADQRTNAVVVSAPDELMPVIKAVVKDIDAMNGEPREVRVFFLQRSTAAETATVILNMFDASMSSLSRGGGREGGGRGRGGRGGVTGTQSPRTQEEGRVMAVADFRTNSLVVSAVSNIMPQIAQVIYDLDRNTAREKKVYVYDLQNADAESVAALLQQMFDQQGGRAGASGAGGNTGRTTGGTTTRGNTRGNTGGGTTTGRGTNGQNN